MTMIVTPVAATTLLAMPESIVGTAMSRTFGRALEGAGAVAEIDELHEFAGRSCYQSWGKPNPGTRANSTYLAHIIESGHESVLEHGSVTFYIEGVSRSLTHELIRHRHLSFSELSQRFVNMESYNTVIPPLFRKNDEAKRIIRKQQKKALKAYAKLVAAAQVEQGATRKQAREAARSVMAGGMETKMVVTGNLRAWRYVIAKRYDPAADAEIQEFAGKVLEHLKHIAPSSVQDLDVRPTA